MNLAPRNEISLDVLSERFRQDAKWGPQHRRDGTSPAYEHGRDHFRKVCDQEEKTAAKASWASILKEEVYEALAETDKEALRKELIQVAAVCAAWVEDLDTGTTVQK